MTEVKVISSVQLTYERQGYSSQTAADEQKKRRQQLNYCKHIIEWYACKSCRQIGEKKKWLCEARHKIWASASNRERQKSNAVFYATLVSARYPTCKANFLKIFRSSSICDSQSHKHKHLLQHNQALNDVEPLWLAACHRSQNSHHPQNRFFFS